MKKYPLIIAIIFTMLLLMTACNLTTGGTQASQDQPPMDQGQPLQQPAGQEQQPQQPAGQGQPPQQPAASGSSILLEQSVSVPPGGGFIELWFDGSASQRVRILLTPGSLGIQPNISLNNPDGSTADIPPIDLTPNGESSVEIDLNQNGNYSLTVFDGSNQGGMITVSITIVQ